MVVVVVSMDEIGGSYIRMCIVMMLGIWMSMGGVGGRGGVYRHVCAWLPVRVIRMPRFIVHKCHQCANGYHVDETHTNNT